MRVNAYCAFSVYVTLDAGVHEQIHFFLILGKIPSDPCHLSNVWLNNCHIPYLHQEEMLTNKIALNNESVRRHEDMFSLLKLICELQGVKNGSQQRKIRCILQFFFDKSENASQVAGIVNGAYGANTETATYVQFWFHRFRSGTFDVKDAPRTGRPVVKSVDKITEIIEVDRHVCSRRIAQELKIDHKTVLTHLCKVGFNKKLDV
ncbi:histone-lysine N-methyltransferase SETMAR [Trichonephila clavipes]|nr:histone-lysine N-methyltransferase SETMAR [Trichonephila clavipes]